MSDEPQDERLQVSLDDDTVARLRGGARQRDVNLNQLVLDLLVAASWHIEELLNSDPES